MGVNTKLTLAAVMLASSAADIGSRSCLTAKIGM
jgi:hypothetical protein